MKSVTGIILAGGKSRRMGMDKSQVSLMGKKLIEFPIDVIKKTTDRIIIIGDSSKINYPNIKQYNDIIPGQGPLGGIYTGLSYSQTELNIITGCDMPFIKLKFLKDLIKHSDNYEVIMFEHSGKFEPLYALYRKRIAAQIRKLIENGKLKLQDIPNYFKTKLIKMDVNNEKLFFSVNTALDLQKAEYILKNEN